MLFDERLERNSHVKFESWTISRIIIADLTLDCEVSDQQRNQILGHSRSDKDKNDLTLLNARIAAKEKIKRRSKIVSGPRHQLKDGEIQVN